MKLPTRKELPDYYEVIRRPVDIVKIQAKIDDGKVNRISKLLFYVLFNSNSIMVITHFGSFITDVCVNLNIELVSCNVHCHYASHPGVWALTYNGFKLLTQSNINNAELILGFRPA